MAMADIYAWHGGALQHDPTYRFFSSKPVIYYSCDVLSSVQGHAHALHLVTATGPRFALVDFAFAKHRLENGNSNSTNL